MYKAATLLAGRTVLFSAYAAGFGLLSAGFMLAFFFAYVRRAADRSMARDWFDSGMRQTKYALADARFEVVVRSFEQTARAMAFAPIVSKGRRSWRF